MSPPSVYLQMLTKSVYTEINAQISPVTDGVSTAQQRELLSTVHSSRHTRDSFTTSEETILSAIRSEPWVHSYLVRGGLYVILMYLQVLGRAFGCFPS